MKELDVNDFTTNTDNSDFVASGSYAAVRRCRHNELGTVVVKCFNLTGSELAINQQSKNISQEAEVLCRLKHKNIIKVFGVTKWSTRYGIVMEEASGYNLEDLVIYEKEKNIPWPVRLRFMSEIAEGLEYLHCHDPKRSYIHGDLKLQNILLSDGLEIKIADFGSVSLLQATGALTSSLTSAPSNQHTPLYSAPELLNNPEMQRTRAMDVYSYAMIGYEIITRKQVFSSSQPIPPDLLLSLIKYEEQKPDPSLIDQIKNTVINETDSEICCVIETIVVGCWKTNPKGRLDIQNVIARLGHLTHYFSDPQHDGARLRKKKKSVSSTQISLKKFDSGFEMSASFSFESKPTHFSNPSYLADGSKNATVITETSNRELSGKTEEKRIETEEEEISTPEIPKQPTKTKAVAEFSQKSFKKTERRSPGLKCVLVGNEAVGKSALIRRYVKGTFREDYIPTKNTSVFTKKIVLNKKLQTLLLIDTAGGENNELEKTMAYNDVDVFLLCFSIVKPSSYKNIKEQWKPKIEKECPKTPIILVGTKSDLRNDQNTKRHLSESKQIPVQRRRGYLLGKEIGAKKYLECSSSTGEGLRDVFEESIRSVLKNRRRQTNICAPKTVCCCPTLLTSIGNFFGYLSNSR